MVAGYLILSSILKIFSFVFFVVLVLLNGEDIHVYQTLKTLFDCIKTPQSLSKILRCTSYF